MAEFAASARAETPRAAAEDAAPGDFARAAAGDGARETLALKRELIIVQDHLADVEARLAKLKPLLLAASLCCVWRGERLSAFVFSPGDSSR